MKPDYEITSAQRGPSYENRKNYKYERSASFMSSNAQFLAVLGSVRHYLWPSYTVRLAQNLPADWPLNKPAHDRFVFIACTCESLRFALTSRGIREFKQSEMKAAELWRAQLFSEGMFDHKQLAHERCHDK